MIAAPAQATFPGAPGMLLVRSGGDYTADDPTDDAAAVPAGTGEHASWSPDGTRIALQTAVSMAADGEEVHVVKVNGGASTVVQHFDTATQGNLQINRGVTWSADGKKVLFLVTHVNSDPDNYPFPQELWSTSADGSSPGGTKLYSWAHLGYTLSDLVMSSDGTQVMARRLVRNASGVVTTNDLVRFAAGGGPVTEIPGSSVPVTDIVRGDWRPGADPDGTGINGWLVARLQPSTAQATVDVYDSTGTKVDTRTGDYGLSLARFTPDGSRIWFTGCVGADCGIVERPIPDPLADIGMSETQEKLLPGSADEQYAEDWQPQRQPVIFIHGFAGSKIACGSNELWLPTPVNLSDDLLNMRLAPDGDSSADGTCGAAPSALLEKGFLVQDVYGSAKTYVEQLAPGRGYELVWDWRRDPRKAVGKLTTLIDSALAKQDMVDQNVTKVAIVAHSMGGIVTRAFVDNPARAKRVARAVTIGTPYLGAVKPFFAIKYGVEVPEGGDLDPLLPPQAFRALAQTMTGIDFLLPTDAFGPWLSVAGLDNDAALSADQTEAYLKFQGAGGTGIDLARAGQNALAGFKTNGVDYRVFYSGGRPTLRRLILKPGAGTGGADDLSASYADGDGTVTNYSATQKESETGTPTGEEVPMTSICGVPHMGQSGDAKFHEALLPFLQRGAFPKKLKPVAGCSAQGKEVRFTNLKTPADLLVTKAAAPATKTKRDASDTSDPAPDHAETYDLPGATIAVTADDDPVKLAAAGQDTIVTITPLAADGTPGTPLSYGPITGAVQVSEGADGTATVSDDGVPVTATGTPPNTGEPPPSGTTPTGPAATTASPTPPAPAPPTSSTTTPVTGNHTATPARATPGKALGGVLTATRTGRITLRVRCPATGARCTGLLQLRLRRSVVGTAHYAVASGKTTTIPVTLTGPAKTALRKHKTLHLTAGTAKLTVKPAKRKP